VFAKRPSLGERRLPGLRPNDRATVIDRRYIFYYAPLAGMTLPTPERRPLERLALVIWTTALTALGLAAISALCWFLVPPIPHDAAFVASHAVLDGFFYPQQPAKSVAFQACVLAAPFIIVAAILVCRRTIGRLNAAVLRRWIVVGLALDLLSFAACMQPLFYDPHPPLWEAPSWLLCPLPFPPPVPTWAWIGAVMAGFGITFWLMVAPPGGRTRRVVAALIFGVAIALAPSEFFAPSEITDDTVFTYHLNAMLDAVSQSINGHHLLVDFPHIYGGYGEMLAPWLRIFPRNMAVPLIALALPTVLALFFCLLIAWLVIRRPALLALCGFSLLGVTYLQALPPNYCYGTPRSFFPALGLLLAALYLRQPSRGGYLLVSITAAIASIWNLDTGLVLWVAWTLTLLAGDVAERNWGHALRHAVMQTAFLVGAWSAFIIYLRLASHQWPDLHLLLYFQTMVVQSGYFCVAMIVPSAWIFLLLLNLTGLVVAALAHFRGRVDWRARMVLLLSLTGVGMFSYYMGRSAESNLIAVCPPGILLAGLLASEAHARMRLHFLPSVTRWFVLPWLAMIVWWAFLLFAHLPELVGREAQVVRDSVAPTVTPLETDMACASTWVKPGESDVFFLSGHSGFYYYMTGTVRPLRVPGNIELLQMRDMNVLLDAIRNRQLPKLVVDPSFYAMDMYRPDVYRALTAAIAANYRPAASAPGGRIILYLPHLPPVSP
jgi:hypothetical protein